MKGLFHYITDCYPQVLVENAIIVICDLRAPCTFMTRFILHWGVAQDERLNGSEEGEKRLDCAPWRTTPCAQKGQTHFT